MKRSALFVLLAGLALWWFLRRRSQPGATGPKTFTPSKPRPRPDGSFYA